MRHPHPPYSFSCFDIRWCTTIPSAKATKRAPLSFPVESVQRFHETNSLCREHCLHAALTVAPLIKEAESCRWGVTATREEVSEKKLFRHQKVKVRRMSSFHVRLTVIQAEDGSLMIISPPRWICLNPPFSCKSTDSSSAVIRYFLSSVNPHADVKQVLCLPS